MISETFDAISLERLSTAAYPNLGGHESVRAAIKAIAERFPHRNPVVNGHVILMDGDLAVAGTFERISFE
jgi:hypothetical protein